MPLKHRFRVLVFLGLAFGVLGCASNNKGKIEGTKWKSQSVIVNGFKLPPIPFERWEFRTDGSVTRNMANGLGVFTGRYSLGFGDSISIKWDDPTDLQTDTKQFVISGEQLTIIDANNDQMILIKEQ